MQFKNHLLLLITFFTLIFLAFASNIHHLNQNSTEASSQSHHNLPHEPSANNSHLHPPQHKHLHSHCKSDFECGRNALCVGGGAQQQSQKASPTVKTCHCKLGFTHAPNKVDCNKVHCKTDSTCHSHFGHRTKCVHSPMGNYCSCASDRYLQLDENSQTCVPVRCGKGGGGAGGNNRKVSCSDGMFCYYGRCRCKLGYLPLPNGYQCKVAHCRADSECRRFDYNARCFATSSENSQNPEFSEILGTCDCDHGFYLDRRSHLCQPNLESITTTRNVFFIVASFIFLIPTVICLIRACQRRRNNPSLDPCSGVQGVEIVAGSEVVSRNGIGIISPVNNAVSRHRILNVLVSLSGERQMLRTGNTQITEIKPPIPDLPPSYELVSSESTETKNLDLFIKVAPPTASSLTTPPPPAYETVLHR